MMLGRQIAPLLVVLTAASQAQAEWRELELGLDVFGTARNPSELELGVGGAVRAAYGLLDYVSLGSALYVDRLEEVERDGRAVSEQAADVTYEMYDVTRVCFAPSVAVSTGSLLAFDETLFALGLNFGVGYLAEFRSARRTIRNGLLMGQQGSTVVSRLASVFDLVVEYRFVDHVALAAIVHTTGPVVELPETLSVGVRLAVYLYP